MKKIGSRAEAGDKRAVEVWKTVGEDLAEVLSVWIGELSLEYVIVVLIARSFRFFAEPLHDLPIETGDLSGDSPLYAADSLFSENQKPES